MSGKMVPVVPKSRGRLDFSSVSGGQTQRVVLSGAVPVERHREATLVVRVHALTIASGHAIAIKAIPTAPSPEDPQLLFWMLEAPAASVTIDSATTVPSGDVGTLLRASFADNFGSHVTIVAEGSRPASPSTLEATVTVCLSLKGNKRGAQPAAAAARRCGCSSGCARLHRYMTEL